MTKVDFIIKALILLIILTLSFGIYLFLNQEKEDTPSIENKMVLTESELTIKENSSESFAQIDNSETFQLRYVFGTIKEIKETIFIVTDMTTGEYVEIAFDSSTKVVAGEGVKELTTSELSIGWNIVAFLLDDENSNFAQMIQLMTRK